MNRRTRTEQTRRTLTRGERLALFRFSDGKCWLCGKDRPGDPFEVDHPYSYADGGATNYGNARLAHRSCNRSKGRKTFVIDQ